MKTAPEFLFVFQNMFRGNPPKYGNTQNCELLELLLKDGEWSCTKDSENKSFNMLKYFLQVVVLCLYAVCSGYGRGDKTINTSLSFWFRWHVMLLRTKLASWNISWDLRTICSAPEPAWKMKHFGTLQGLLGNCQSFTCCIGTSKTIQRERGERKSGPPSPGTTSVTHTGWLGMRVAFPSLLPVAQEDISRIRMTQPPTLDWRILSDLKGFKM